MSAVTSGSVGELHQIAQRLARLPEDKQRVFLKQLREHGIDFQRLPIVAGPRPARLPLSHAQQHQWLLWKLRPASAAYHLAMALRLRGDLDADALQEAFNVIARRHESLRTRFCMEDGEVFQVVGESSRVPFSLVEIGGDANREARARALMDEELCQPFDLEAQMPIRVKLFRLGPADHVLLAVLHHIVADAWSLDLLMEELAALYAAQRLGRSDALAALPIQYADFALWQRRWMKAEELQRQLDYWRNRLGETALTPELLPLDRPRHDGMDDRCASHACDFSRPLSGLITRFAQEHGTTVFTVLLASLKVLLHRYSGQRDVRVGTPVVNRQRMEVEGLIGFFVNTQVLRTDVDGDLTFAAVVGRVKQGLGDALAHRDLPFEQLVEALKPRRSLASNPLFHVLYTHQVGSRRAAARLPGLDVEPMAQERHTAQVDLGIATTEQSGGMAATLVYATALYDQATIARFADHWCNLLQRLLDQPRVRISNLDLLSQAEHERMLVQWNDTDRTHAGPETLHTLIENRAAGTPDAVCVEFDGVTLRYADLNRRADLLAAKLRAFGVRPDDRVAICAHRCLPLVPSLLGIMKAGAAYVPLDPDYPIARLSFMLGDARPRVVLAQRALAPLLQSLGGDVPVWYIDELSDGIEASVDRTQVHAENLAYCIYTSGSTGQPKGVAIRHRGIVNFIRGAGARLGLQPGDRVLALASLSFDMSCLDMFLPLAVGARLVLVDRAIAGDPVAVLNCIHDLRITTLQATPTLWRMLVSRDTKKVLSGCKVFCGGESLPPDLAEQLVESTPAVWNLYGPTETSVYSSIHAITATRREPLVGVPIDNTAIHLLNEALQPVPIGVTGDLYIGGAGAARGYLGRAALTADRFVPNPFPRGAGERLYRTGDLGRYRSDGVIECLGRMDQQIKIRGFRIELGEIEARLQSHEAVHEAAVAAHAGPEGEKFLVAYVVTNEVAPTTEGLLFQRLSDHVKAALPSYMVPAHYVRLASLPQTANGKIDRKALGLPVRTEHARDTFVAPRNTLESELIALWEEALAVRPIGIHDNFFALGGHSLLAVQLTETLSRGIGRTVPISQLFRSQTVAELAEALSAPSGTHDMRSLVVLEATGERPALCCIHPGGGQVLGYRALARHFRGQRPVYGLQSRLFCRDDWVDASIEAMAAYYAEQIVLQAAGRPLHLLGWSAGCLVAMEMARHLQERRYPVSFVGMIDPVSLLGGEIEARAEFNDEQEAARRFATWLERARCRTQWTKLLELCDASSRRELLRLFNGKDIDGHSLSVAEEYVFLSEAQHFMLMERYRFTPVASTVHIWWAAETLRSRGLVTAALPAGMIAEAHTVEADHLSIVNSLELHRELRTLLEEHDLR